MERQTKKMEQLFRKEANKLDITNKPEKLDRFSMLMNTQTETISKTNRFPGMCKQTDRHTDKIHHEAIQASKGMDRPLNWSIQFQCKQTTVQQILETAGLSLITEKQTD